MKFTLTLLAVFTSFILATHAQTVVKENVVKIPSTNALTESIVIPSGLSLTINSGATITNNGTATGFGSGGTWGSITGTLSAQTDLQGALDQKLSLSSAASNYAPIANPTFTGLVTVPGANGLVINSGGSTAQIDFYGSGLSRTYLKAGTFSGVKTVTLPATTGTLITTGDTGTVTDAMLAGSITPSKITGTAAILGANTFTGTQSVPDLSYSGNITPSSSGYIQTRNFFQALDSSGAANRVLIGESFNGIKLSIGLALAFTAGGAETTSDFTLSRTAASVLGLSAAAFELEEMTAPAGAANKARIYTEDNGSGKTRLMVIFGSGAAVQIAIEP